MSALKTIYSQVLKREPTQEELSRAIEAASALDIADNDEMLLIFLYFLNLRDEFMRGNEGVVRQNLAAVKEYRQEIEKITRAKSDEFFAKMKAFFGKAVAEQRGVQKELYKGMKDCLDHADSLHEDFLKKLDQKIEKSLMAKVSEVTRKASETASTRLSIAYVGTWAGAICALFIFSVAYTAHFAYDKGLENGFSQARDEALVLKQRDDFLKTQQGLLAMDFDKQGLLGKILECRWPGWQIREHGGKRICYPIQPKDGAEGWVLP